MHSEAYLKDLILRGESQEVEFKSSWSSREAVTRLILGFANSTGGTIIFGVNDERHVIGVDEDVAKTLESYARRLISSLLRYPNMESGPRAAVGVSRVDEKLVVSIYVVGAPEYAKPVTDSRGNVFVRRRERIEKIPIANSERRYRRERIPEPSSPQGAEPNPHKRLFVAMCFRDEEEPALQDYYGAIKRAVLATNLPIKVSRMDEIEGDYEISQAILTEIDNSDIVLADFTLQSANVYFEVGYARGKGKTILHCARVDVKLQFDVRSWRTTFYRNATELEVKSTEAIRDAYDRCVNPKI